MAPSPGTNVPEMLFYRESVRYAGQLERYFSVFGRDRVHVILYDDFSRDTAGAYRAVLKFLDVDPDFAPEFRVVNPAKRPRSQSLKNLVATPPSPIRRAARAAIPRAMRKRMSRLLRLNARTAPRSPLSAQFRQSLIGELTGERQRLADLLGWDLSAWERP